MLKHVPTSLTPKAAVLFPELLPCLVAPADLPRQVPGGIHKTCHPLHLVTSDRVEMGDMNHVASTRSHVPPNRSQAWVPAQLTPQAPLHSSAAGGDAPPLPTGAALEQRTLAVRKYLLSKSYFSLLNWETG